MANNPKKVKDPTEVALSAIQEALNISDAPEVETPRAVDVRHASFTYPGTEKAHAITPGAFA